MSGKNVETLGEVMIRIERHLVERARAGTAETGCDRAGRRNTEVVLPLMIAGQSDVGFAVVGVFHARPPDLHDLGRIKIVVFDAAHEITALVRGANAQRVRRVVLPDVFVAAKELERVPRIFGGDHNGVVVGHDAIYGVVRSDQIGPGDGVCIDAVGGRLIGRRRTLRPQQGVQYADRLVVMLEDDVGGELAVVSAEVESIGVVMRRFRRTGGGSPGCGGRVAAARTIGEFIHRAEMDRAIGEAIFQGVVPTGVLGVAAAGHRAVIPDVRKGIGAAGRIVKEHRIGAESALTTEGQRAEMRGRYTAIDIRH